MAVTQMTPIQQIGTIAIVIAVTVFTRAVAFWVFPEGKKTPPFIAYLGKVLPAAVFGMLVIYCLKDCSFAQANQWVPELFAIGLITAIHVWKRNMFLSIAAGTAAYMLLSAYLF